MKNIEITSHKLANGAEIPVLGLGTFQASDKDELVKAIRKAVEIGYRHIDCAWAYQNEDVIGETLKNIIAESNGQLKREHFFITSKLWNSFHSKEQAQVCLSQTLKNLQLDYLDLYLIHWPMGYKEQAPEGPFPMDKDGKPLFSDIHFMEAYHAMEEFHKQGKVKSIGVSNFNIEQLQEVIQKSTIKPVVNQFEINPYCQNDKLIEFCQKNNVAVEGYAPLGAAKKLDGKDLPALTEHPALVEIGKKYNKSAAQVILRWVIQRDVIVLAKSVTPQRIEDNMNVFDFKLSDEDVQKIKQLNENARAYLLEEFSHHPLYPFKDEMKAKKQQIQ